MMVEMTAMMLDEILVAKKVVMTDSMLAIVSAEIEVATWDLPWAGWMAEHLAVMLAYL